MKLARPAKLSLFSSRSPLSTFEVSSYAVQKLYELFNAQITNELAASQLYLSASIWCEGKEFVGMASYMRKESDEERFHALSLIDFANKRDIPIRLEEVPAPEYRWDTLEDLWSNLLECERANTQALYEVADAAQACHDHAITTLLMPFHTEQVESEGNLKTILAKVREENLTPGLVYQLDTELGNTK
jgi:ferritin